MHASKVLTAILLSCIFLIHEVNSGIIFDGVRKVAGKVKCGLHKIGSSVYDHEHKHGDPCEKLHSSTETPIERTTITVFDENVRHQEKANDDGKNFSGSMKPVDVAQDHEDENETSANSFDFNKGSIDNSSGHQDDTRTNNNNNNNTDPIVESKISVESYNKKDDAKDETNKATIPEIDVRGQSNKGKGQSTTVSTPEAEYATVPNGKRLIEARANCPAGTIGDVRGNCREEA